jgi:PIN domain
MPSKILYFFVDTNLFVQCHALGQLNWAVWTGSDDVHLIVARPVQSEIDRQKNRGNDRLGRRARSASGLFRETILSEPGHKVLRNGSPLVKLFIRPELKPNRDLSDRLDYQEPDDQLVGIAHAFLQQHPSADVRVLTHDTGPLASARMVGLPVETIPDDWLLPPESTRTEKRINELEGEVARLRRAEPEVRLRCLDPDGNEIKAIEIESLRYLELTEGELSNLLGRLRAGLPMANAFGRQVSAKGNPKMGESATGVATETFIPATDEEILAYRNERYPRWLNECKQILRDYHNRLEMSAPLPTYTFAVGNDGTRPAKDALITIEAKGRFEVMPPAKEDKDEENEVPPLVLPQPPRAPCGRINFENTV